MNLHTIYKISLKKLVKQPITYICGGVALVVCLVAFLFIPWLNTGHDLYQYYESSTWIEFSQQATLVVFMIAGAVIGETNAISSEKIYFLSKPIKRNTFLWAKCLATITISLLITLICSCILIYIAIYCTVKRNVNIFNHGFGLGIGSGEEPINYGYVIALIFGGYVLVSLAGSFISTVWKYQLRGGVCLIVCLLLIAIYTVLYPTLVELSKGDFDDDSRFWWVTIPVIVYPALTIILATIGWFVFLKSEVES